MFGRRAPSGPPPPPPILSGQLLIFGCQGWIVGFAFLVGLHTVCYTLARSGKGSVLGPLSKDPQLAAHFLPQLIAFAASAWYGGGDWLLTMPAQHPPAADVAAAYLPQGERIACIMIAFQLYELLACIPCPRLRGGINELVGHHCIVLLLSFLVYYKQAFQWYAPCFMGMAEISSIPLAFVDLFKHFPELRKRFPVTNEAIRNVFALTFLVFRGVYWPYSGISFWQDALAVLESAMVVPSTPIVYTFLVCNILMTLLQWYWASIILTAIIRMATGDARHKEA